MTQNLYKIKTSVVEWEKSHLFTSIKYAPQDKRSQLSNVLHFPLFLEGMNNDSEKA